MPRNIEIKARVGDINHLKKLAKNLLGSEPTVLEQRDTFYESKNGRLKLREILNEPKRNELIYYSRPDVSGPKLSDFIVYPCKDPDTLKDILCKTNGEKGMVHKTRYLYIVGQTRIHVDQVKNLGDYMELEVMLNDDQTIEDGQAIAQDFKAKLEIKDDQLMTGAYMDMLANGDK